MTVVQQRVESPAVPLASGRGRWVLAATILGSGIVFLDGTVVNVALPAMQADLAAPLSGLQWIVDAYALFLAALLLVGGALGDIYGRKMVFIIGLALFTVASAGCGLAPSLAVLIAARAIQGVGGALLVPGSLAMIKAIIAPADSGRAIGLWTGLSSVTSALGPLLGGYLVHAISWRAIFFLNVPLAVVTIAITLHHVPSTRDPNATHELDWPGALATVAGLGALTYGLIGGPAMGWGSGTVVAALVVGAVCLLLFPLLELRAHQPMVPLSLFRSRNFSGSNLVTLGVYFCLYGALLFVVLDLQQVLGYSPLGAGAALLPFTLLLLLLSPRVGALTDRVGARLPMTVGPLLVAAGFALFLFMGRSSSYVTGVLPAVFLLGLGMAIFITPLTATVLAAVPPDVVGVASGVNNAVSRVAAVLAIAILGIVVQSRFSAALPSHLAPLHLSPPARHALLGHRDRLADDPIPPAVTGSERVAAGQAVKDAFVEGFHWAMGLCVLLCLLSGIASAFLIRGQASRPAEA